MAVWRLSVMRVSPWLGVGQPGGLVETGAVLNEKFGATVLSMTFLYPFIFTLQIKIRGT
jgi:hypothetical protein